MLLSHGTLHCVNSSTRFLRGICFRILGVPRVTGKASEDNSLRDQVHNSFLPLLSPCSLSVGLPANLVKRRIVTTFVYAGLTLMPAMSQINLASPMVTYLLPEQEPLCFSVWAYVSTKYEYCTNAVSIFLGAIGSYRQRCLL